VHFYFSAVLCEKLCVPAVKKINHGEHGVTRKSTEDSFQCYMFTFDYFIIFGRVIMKAI